MPEKAQLTAYLLVWAGLLPVAVMIALRRGAGVGLVLAFLFQYVLFYGVGGLIHALPWSELPQSDYVVLGFEQATYGLAGFVLGQLAGSAIAGSLSAKRSAAEFVQDPRMPQALILFGLAFTLLIKPILGGIPSIGAVVAGGQQLVVVGLCLGTWQAWTRGGASGVKKWLAYALVVPLFTMLTMGFLGFGVMVVSLLLLFLIHFYRPRWKFVLGYAVATYAGLSFYVAYMEHRDTLRRAVWLDEGGWSARIDALAETIASITPFDASNPDHLLPIDIRLNQNPLAGAAVVYLKASGDFAHGETIVSAFYALIPRAIWPGKPFYAGSGDLVTRFTGIEFSRGTSVGVGNVLELYANFATNGVFFGLLLIGAVVAGCDRLAAGRLHNGDWRGFAGAFLVGLSLINVGGALAEAAGSAAAAWLVGQFVSSALERYQFKVPRNVRVRLVWRAAG